MQNTKQRLVSLDALRGFDLFVLVALGPLVLSFTQAAGPEHFKGLRAAFTHVDWEGFSPWDLIMPLFVFMSGASIPFALSRFRNGANRSLLVRRLLKRVLLLWLLGMVVQGNLLGLDPSRFYVYTNTLQAIAAGYLIAALLFTNTRLRTQVIVAVLLLLGYWAAMEFVSVDGYGAGSYAPESNLAEWIDRTVLGRFRDGASVNEAGQVVFAPWYHYTWLLSTATFGVTALTGVFAGSIARASWSGMQKVLVYFGLGVAMVALGWLWDIQMPVIKTIWTSSMVLVSSGYCFLLMAVFYLLFDVFHFTFGLYFLRVYGMNSITAYVISEVVNFRGVAHSVLYGLEQHVGGYYTFVLTFSQVLIVYLILRSMYKHGVFVKV
ncbi:MAG: DUF5009 domain-containing protein [Bacteroidaceae bacterium]|nr:DUF5009 domain-containing protein [Bacteroidaceae bacterium]